MRTTVTLEDDLYVLLERRRAERDESFKATLNEVVRAGLRADVVDAESRGARFEVRPLDVGGRRLDNLDDLDEVLSYAEGEKHR